MHSFISNLAHSQYNLSFDQSLYEQLEKPFPGTAKDYKYETFKPPNVFLFFVLNELIIKYASFASIPKRINFLTKQLIEPNRAEIEKIEFDFWQNAPNFNGEYLICSNCSKSRKGDEDCCECFLDNYKFGQTFSDISRTNLSTKYSYFRRQHFFECLMQFQGKQHVTICPKILEKLEQLFNKNHNDNLTKYNVTTWLKDMNATRHYGDVHLIYSLLTKIPCANLEAIECELLNDFDMFLCEYNKNWQDELNTQRKNFINIQYVLFQLLNRREYHFKQDEFILPRTIEIRKNYERMCQKIFNNLGWNLTSICLN